MIQLDSMIAAVKVESSALDSMKEKLREVDALRNQISTFTKRLLDADQANLNLKTNLVKVQEAYTELKKSKAEVSLPTPNFPHLTNLCKFRLSRRWFHFVRS